MGGRDGRGKSENLPVWTGSVDPDDPLSGGQNQKWENWQKNFEKFF